MAGLKRPGAETSAPGKDDVRLFAKNKRYKSALVVACLDRFVELSRSRAPRTGPRWGLWTSIGAAAALGANHIGHFWN